MDWRSFWPHVRTACPVELHHIILLTSYVLQRMTAVNSRGQPLEGKDD
jgi:hypothetical protein